MLTANDHHANGEHFFVIRVRGHVAESDGGHACHRKVKRRHVHCGPWRSSDQFRFQSFLVDCRKIEWLNRIFKLKFIL